MFCQELDSQPGDPKWLDVIEKDLHRQFPFHEMFVARGGHGWAVLSFDVMLHVDVYYGVLSDIHMVFILASYRQQDLFRVLKAYTLYRPEEGYCQAQAPIAAVLLMHMPAEVLPIFHLFTHIFVNFVALVLFKSIWLLKCIIFNKKNK